MGKDLSATTRRWQKLLQHPSFFQWPQCTKPCRPSPQMLSGLGPGRQDSRWRTTARGARGVPRARGPSGLGSELSNSRTPGATNLHLFPLLVQLPMCPPPPPHLGEPLQPDQCLVLSSQSPESPRRRCGLAILQHPADCGVRSHWLPPAPPPPRWGYRLMKRSFSLVICFVFLQSSDK